MNGTKHNVELVFMPVDENGLTKGQRVKLNALRKSIGEDLAENVFEKWLKRQSSRKSVEKPDPTAEKLLALLTPLDDDQDFRLGNQGYTVRRARKRRFRFRCHKERKGLGDPGQQRENLFRLSAFRRSFSSRTFQPLAWVKRCRSSI